MPEKMVNKAFKQKLFTLAEVREGREEIYKKIYLLPFELDKKDFIKMLRKLLNYPDGVEALKNNWRIVLNNSSNPEEVLEVYSTNPDISKLVVSDVPYLMNYSNIIDYGKIVKQLSLFEGGEEAIVENFDELFKFCFSNRDIMFISALSTANGIKKAKENFDALKEEATVEEFFRFIEKVKDIPEFEEEYKRYSFWVRMYSQVMPADPENLDIYQIMELNSQQAKKMLELQDAPKIINLTFKKLITSNDLEEKQLILEAVSNGKPFEYKSIGSSSLVLKTGEQIVKLGSGRRKFEVPYHPRIMMPYFRKQYEDNSVLEVYNLGITESAQITDYELLNIYKELESAGILWGDARKENLLVLREDNNLPDFIRNSPDFNVFGFLEDAEFPTNEHKVLKKGDIVICDLDYLYAKDDPDYSEGMPDDIIEAYLISKRRKDKGEGRE